MQLRVEDLPFHRRDPHELFGIVPGRVGPDRGGDSIEYGWVRLEEVALGSSTGPIAILRDAVVIALHSPDLDNPIARTDVPEVELDLRLGSEPDAELVSVIVPLQRFLDVHATEVIGHAREVLLAWCNPRRLRPSPPRWLDATRRLHFASGDVMAWLDPLGDGRERFRFQAEVWDAMTGTRPTRG